MIKCDKGIGKLSGTTAVIRTEFMCILQGLLECKIIEGKDDLLSLYELALKPEEELFEEIKDKLKKVMEVLDK